MGAPLGELPGLCPGECDRCIAGRYACPTPRPRGLRITRFTVSGKARSLRHSSFSRRSPLARKGHTAAVRQRSCQRLRSRWASAGALWGDVSSCPPALTSRTQRLTGRCTCLASSQRSDAPWPSPAAPAGGHSVLRSTLERAGGCSADFRFVSAR